MYFQRSGWLLFHVSLTVLLFVSRPIPAQTGQTNGVTGSPNTNTGVRAQPAPWRPSFGTIARQTTPPQQTPSNIPTRQPVATGSGLPLPNSPPAGINLQNGTGTFRDQLPPPTTNPALPAPIAPAITGGSNSRLPSFSAVDSNSSTVTNSSTPADQQFEAVQINSRRSITRVTRSLDQLPNDSGQVWREYDISPYIESIKDVEDPQQAILDWILKETGTEMWFNQPLGVLNADRNQLRVYHTPEIQKIVHDIVDRFVNTKGQVQNLEVSLVTISNPNWRTDAYPVLQPIEVQSPGAEAWMVTKENAALLRSALARRADFKDHGTGRIAHHDGQSVVLRKTAPVQFVQNLRWVANQNPSYQPLIKTIDEGYVLEISSLSSLDGNTVEATIQCHVDQVEKLDTVKVDVPGTIGATTNRVSLQIPQIVSWRLKERFRWRDDQVLLLSCGVVASPGPEASSALNLPRVFGGSNPKRADALLFVDYRGPQLPGNVPQPSANSRLVPVNRR